MPNPSPRTFALGEGTGTGTASLTIGVGSTLPKRVVVEPVPASILSPGTSAINAFVLDESGNPVSGVPIFFSLASADATPADRLESGGRPVFTDANGFAHDFFFTTSPPTSGHRTVRVEVATPNGLRPNVAVSIN
jgi:hypothetical protein